MRQEEKRGLLPLLLEGTCNSGQCKIFARQMTPGKCVCAVFPFATFSCWRSNTTSKTHRILQEHGIIRSSATNTMLKAIKKCRAKKADKDRRLTDPAITHMEKERCQGQIKNESKEKTFDGLDVTWSISTGQSSDQDLYVSASAATPLRRNVRESKSDEQIQASTASEELPSLAGPSMASSLRRLRLKADLQLAKQKLELMNHYANDSDVHTATTYNKKNNAGDTSLSRPSPVYQRRRSNRLEDDNSLITESSRLPVDMTCDAYAADDIIEAGALVTTCGIMSNFRPIFGSLLEDEESKVTDGEDSTVGSRETFQSHLPKSTFVNNMRNLSGKSDRETILMAPSRQERQQAKLVVDSEDIVIGKYGRYVLVST